VKAQAQSIIARVRSALDELEETVDTLPDDEREVTIDDGHAAGTDPSH
jgi:hypothetical protein